MASKRKTTKPKRKAPKAAATKSKKPSSARTKTAKPKPAKSKAAKSKAAKSTAARAKTPKKKAAKPKTGRPKAPRPRAKTPPRPEDQARFLDACSTEDMSTFRKLLPYVDVNVGVDSLPPLFWAVIHGNDEMFAELLRAGVDVNLRNQHGATALHYAAYTTDRVDMARELLARGADVHARTKNNFPTPLHKAAIEGDLALLELLLEAGAEPNDRGCPTGMSILEAARARDRTEIVARLRAAGAKD